MDSSRAWYLVHNDHEAQCKWENPENPVGHTDLIEDSSLDHGTIDHRSLWIKSQRSRGSGN